MTLKELLDRISELCNDETKDLQVKVIINGETALLFDVWHYKLRNDYVEINEIRML